VLSELHIDLGGLLAPITGDILAQRIEYHGRQVIGSLGSLVSGMASRLLGAGIQTRAMQR
jgi:ubiquinone biosynthesis protein UbiJ